MAEDTTTTAAVAPAPKAKTTSKKKQRRSVPSGQLHIQATFNNTIVSFTDKKGNVLAASSAGACGFRGSKKGTAYASQVATEKAAEVAKSLYGLSSIDVFVKGVGLGRDAAVRAVGTYGINVDSITDVTGVPHGGVRPKGARRA
jgi:small subunit ribosomal protein S11